MMQEAQLAAAEMLLPHVSVEDNALQQGSSAFLESLLAAPTHGLAPLDAIAFAEDSGPDPVADEIADDVIREVLEASHEGYRAEALEQTPSRHTSNDEAIGRSEKLSSEVPDQPSALKEALSKGDPTADRGQAELSESVLEDLPLEQLSGGESDISEAADFAMQQILQASDSDRASKEDCEV